MRGSRSTRFGFSLIEMLVAISIIALLIAILLPVLGKARTAALRTQCLSNMRQIGTGFSAYAADNERWYPWRADGQVIRRTYNPFDWSNLGRFDAHSVIEPYVTPSDVYLCPLADSIFGRGNWEDWWPSTANASNVRHMWPDYATWANFATFGNNARYYQPDGTELDDSQWSLIMPRRVTDTKDRFPLLTDRFFIIPNRNLTIAAHGGRLDGVTTLDGQDLNALWRDGSASSHSDGFVKVFTPNVNGDRQDFWVTR